jgi:hypothetical protein
VVLEEVRRTTWYVRASMLMDLNLVDEEYVLVSGPYDIEVGGTFAGVTIPQSTVRLEDGAKFQIQFDRIGPRAENDVIQEWYDVMLGRIRGALSTARYEGPFLFEAKPWEYRII